MKTVNDTDEDVEEEIPLQLQQQNVKTRTEWVKFGARFSNLHFLGKDVVAIRIGCHILFHDLSTHTDTIYTANNRTSGYGITCVTGHRNNAMFAFGEKCLNPRIFIKEFPSFSTISILKGGNNSHYISIAFSEMEVLISLNSLPDFEITVWSWRTGEKLVTQKTGVNNEIQILRCSQAIPPVVGQMGIDSQKLLLWELHTCCKKCLLTRLEFNIDTAVLPCAFTWSPDGMLFIIDAIGSVFMIEVEKRKLQHIFDWTGRPGVTTPSVVWYKTGIVLSGPCGEVKYYKKVGVAEWQVIWSIVPDIQLSRLSAYSGKDHLVAMSKEADLMQLKIDDEAPRFITISSYGKHFKHVCFINPPGDHIATLNATDCINTWAVNSGHLVGKLEWNKNCLVMVSNPVQPYLALGRDDGIVDFINVFAPYNPKILTAVNLCKEGISGIQISLQGNYVVACTMETGIFFVIESNPGVQMGVKSFINTKVKIASFLVLELKTQLQIIALISTRICCPSGNKIILCSMAYESKELVQQTSIDLPGLYSGFYVNPFGKYDFYAIPHRSRQLHLLHMSLEKQTLKLVDARSTGHQLRKYSLSVTEHNILTYGLDGMAFLLSVETKDCIVFVMPHYSMDLGIKTAVVNPLNTYIVSLGHDGSMICTYLRTKVDRLKQSSLSCALLTKEISHTYTKRETSGFISMIGSKDAKSWLDVQEDIKIMQEAAIWGKEKSQLREQFRSIQKECVALLEKNYANPPEEKLAVSAFDLDEDTRTDKITEAQDKCKEIELYLKALMVAQDKLCETLKQRYWDTMETKDIKLKAILGRTEVENYPLFPKDVPYEEEFGWIIERRKLEVQMQKGDYFSPWNPSDEDFEVSLHPSLGALDDSHLIRETITSLGSIHEEEEEQRNHLALTGSSSYHFVEPCAYHHSQFELDTYLQMHNEIILLLNVSATVRDYFNKQFNDIYALKEREMFLVTERNARLRYVLSEMNNTWTEISDPEWSQEEQPERIMKVEDNEVLISPYISPSQQEILDRLAAEAEARRLAELADNFRERALIVMMDGVLEVRWEDEIKKDIPKPKCMLEKNPEDYNEEDLRIIKDYEERVEFRLSERERYRKMLEAEFQKLSQTLKDGVMKFNGRLADLFLLKLKIEAAIGQETLKVNQYKYMVHKRLSLDKEEKRLKMVVIKQEYSNVALQEQIQQLQTWTNDCRIAYDALVAREKYLEKNFKKDFPEVSQVVLEQLLKFYRRRPKMHQRAQTSVILLNELSRCTVSADRPSFLPPEYLDFLKGLDHIDNYSNSPPIINEDTWSTLCRARRLKVECELKAKCCALEVADSEHTVSVYQKKLTGEKQHISVLQDEIHKTKEQLLELQHNTELQIVMKQGLVEINTTGSLSDFDDAILITREQVESVNELVKNAGNQKLTAMHRATNFRRSILVKEWEHKKLRMEIEDLQEHLQNLESIKVTRDIQMFLRRRARGINEDKSILAVERELAQLKESYEKEIQELQKQLDDLDKKIGIQKKANQKLDAKVTDLNVDVNEQQLLRDLEFETRQTGAAKQRMASIVKRSQLVTIIQNQHTEILALQTELELLRLKTYPTLKYKTLI